MPKTKAKPKRRPQLRIELREDVVRGLAPLAQGQARVDREKKIIFGVKVLGRDSANGRKYTPEAVQDAYQRRIYEGVAVYTDHPLKPNDPRPVRTKLGRIVNVRVIEGELFGDLEYLEANADTTLIVETAERMPEQMGLSHNAQGEGDNDAEGVFIVQKIVEVRSVDVVTEPATTGGFFEARQAVKITVKQLFENSWKKYAGRCTKRPRLAAVLKRLVEDDAYDVMDDEAGAEAVPADHEEALKGGFEASVAAIVKKCLDGEEEPGECIKKIGELLKAHDKLTGGKDDAEDDMEEEEEPKPKEGGEKETEEQKEIKLLKRKDKARELCEEAELPLVGKPGKVLLKALVRCENDAEMKELIEHEKAKPAAAGSGGGNRNAPRSGATGGSNTQTKPTLEGVETPEGFMAALLG